MFSRNVMAGTIAHWRKSGLSAPQAGTLLYLQRCGSSMVTRIGDHLGVTNAAVSQMLERLVQQGYVARLEDPEDRRARRISLTPKGEAAVRDGIEAGRAWLDDVVAGVDPAQREGTMRVLVSLCEIAARVQKLPRPNLVQ